MSQNTFSTVVHPITPRMTFAGPLGGISVGVAENQINCRNFLLHPGKQWVRARSTRRRIAFEKSTRSKRRKGQGDVVNIGFGSLDSSQAICPLPLPWGSNHHAPNRPPAPSDRGFIFQLGRYFVLGIAILLSEPPWNGQQHPHQVVRQVPTRSRRHRRICREILMR